MSKELIDEIIKNKNIASFLKENNLNRDFVNKHINTFMDSYNSYQKCLNCLGLLNCQQDKIGEILSLAYDVSVYNEITYCPYYVNKLKKDKEVNSYIRSDIPNKFNDIYLDSISLPDLEIENLCSLCFDLLDEKRKKGLYIYGNLGVGKTYMCIALANSLVKKGEKVAFIKSSYFVNEMRKAVASNNDEYETIIKSIKKVKYLFIDDIGSESVSTFTRDDLLFNILDYRMENKLTTCFTSNLSKESLLKHYTYDKNDNSSIIRAKRLLERIDI